MIAYFSMEIAMESDLPTYAGGLGVLAGDTLRAAADIGLPMVGMTLAHREGYFRQRVDARGLQDETPERWLPAERLEPVEPRVEVALEGRSVAVRAWRYRVRGEAGEVPVYLLDTDLPENRDEDRAITRGLYRGELADRLRQELVLGLGGVALLEAVGHVISTYHMNEGHSAFLGLALLADSGSPAPPSPEALSEVRRRCVFTTHTPVPAGRDRFSVELVRPELGEEGIQLLAACGAVEEDAVDMTLLALGVSRDVNAVSLRHRQVTQDMFPDRDVRAITNGVHAPTWTAPAFRALFDRHVPGWRRQNAGLRQAIAIPLEDVRAAHETAKRDLLGEIERRAGKRLDPVALTIGFARRATAYKRADLVFRDTDRLRRIAHGRGPLQLVFGGKAHPKDEAGKAMIRRVVEAGAELGGDVPVVWLDEYDMELARVVCAGVDLWLNTPQKPMEASGTSGMKAALNGVPSLSVLDGWWIEGHVEGVTGWSIGEDPEPSDDPEADARSLYDKLEDTVLPFFYDRPEAWAAVMRSAIALNGSHFTAERMLRQYDRLVYRPALSA